MPRIGLLAHAGDTWTYALVGGLVGIPFTIVTYWRTGSELSLSPVFFGAVLAGYLATRKTGRNGGVGARAGLIGALPALWFLFTILRAAFGLSGPLWFVAGGTFLTVLFTVVFLGIGFGLAALIGEAGGRIGDWIAESAETR